MQSVDADATSLAVDFLDVDAELGQPGDPVQDAAAWGRAPPSAKNRQRRQRCRTAVQANSLAEPISTQDARRTARLTVGKRPSLTHRTAPGYPWSAEDNFAHLPRGAIGDHTPARGACSTRVLSRASVTESAET